MLPNPRFILSLRPFIDLGPLKRKAAEKAEKAPEATRSKKDKNSMHPGHGNWEDIAIHARGAPRTPERTS